MPRIAEPPETSMRAFAAGLDRLDDRLAALDQRRLDVLACHLAVEEELDDTLAALVEDPASLTNVPYKHKVSVLSSCSPGWARGVDVPLIAFNHLRDSAAHPKHNNFDLRLSSLRTAIRGLWPNAPVDGLEIKELAGILILCLVLIREPIPYADDEGGPD